MQRFATPPGDGPWAGLLVDAWTERIPATHETTGIALHHDDPGAEAPQAILLAVPPAGVWDLPTLLDIVGETLDLAKVRAVDRLLLEELTQILPGIYLAANVDGDTVSTDFTGLVAVDPLRS
jgi:hypothetical protein